MATLLERWQRCMRSQTDPILDALVDRYEPGNPGAWVAIEDIGRSLEAIASMKGNLAPRQEIAINAWTRLPTGPYARGFELSGGNALMSPAEKREYAERTAGMTAREADRYRADNPIEPERHYIRLTEPMRAIVDALVRNPDAHAIDERDRQREREERDRAERHADDAYAIERSGKYGELHEELNRLDREGRARIEAELAGG